MAVIKFVESLPRTPANQVTINQILKSVTSVGVNDQEADGAAAKKEFVHRCSIVRKEGKETSFWLRLIGETNPKKQERAEDLKAEGEEMVAIVSRIIANASRSSVRRK